MILKEVSLKPATIWEVYSEINNFEDYKARLPKTILNKHVCEDVIQHYETILKLLEFGYFEYRFITVAFRDSLVMLEMILKQFYLKNEPEVKEKMTLHGLIEWFSKNSLLDNREKQQLNNMRELRNHFLHPTKNSVHTLSSIANINVILGFANKFSTIATI
jgi:hypothetical protein